MPRPSAAAAAPPTTDRLVPAPLRRLDTLDAARRATTAAARMRETLAAAGRLREQIRESGQVRRVRTRSLATFPYPTVFGLAGAARSPAPYLMMTNRLQIVDFDADGRTWRLLVNPSDPIRNASTPYFERNIRRYGELVARRLLSTLHATVADALAAEGVSPDSVDFVTFDHLHTQDLCGLLGSTSLGLPPLLPRARLLVQRAELDAYRDLHPLQKTWYPPRGLDGVAPERFVVLDGDYLVGAGVAIVFTPGHTLGNHTIVLNTERGLWTISENGIAVDAYVPLESRIPGVADYARREEVEVILNANTREATLEQYNSMLLERAIADRVPGRPELPQHFPSSELTASLLAPGLSPTYTHGAITSG